eukprot:TRINITY_DN5556_c0_g1_i1.p1 TRINITY_DN5556_c0_g1~~TRINITY_DN5556_c0_g1_i1.p1  ORF type:complete len:425 (+),score=151.63 TRINITY_DN5556_c0_g1_i1:2-1276(+)
MATAAETVPPTSSQKEEIPAQEATQTPEVAEVESAKVELVQTEEKKVEIRENFVQNAVAFLQNPSVKSTPMARKVAFLEHKGLTSEEITEAMSRVSQSGSASAPVSAPIVNNSIIVQNPATTAPPKPWQKQDPNAPALPVRPTRAGVYTPLLPPPPPPAPSTPTWKIVLATAILTGGLLAGISFFLKNYLLDYLGFASVSPKKITTTTTTTTTNQIPQPSVAEIANGNEMQRMREDMKTMMLVVKQLAQQQQQSLQQKIDNPNATASSFPTSNSNPSTMSKADPAASETASAETQAPYSKSFMDVMKKISEGEKPDDIEQVNDKPADPNPIILPGAKQAPLKPWEKRRMDKAARITEEAQKLAAAKALEAQSESKQEKKEEKNEETKEEKKEIEEEVAPAKKEVEFMPRPTDVIVDEDDQDQTF